MKRRRRRKKSCPCHKRIYSTFRLADRVAHRTKDAERPYWCPEAGGYHITGIPKAEWDRAQALRSS